MRLLIAMMLINAPLVEWQESHEPKMIITWWWDGIRFAPIADYAAHQSIQGDFELHRIYRDDLE